MSIIQALVAIGHNERYASVVLIPGVEKPGQVIHFADSLRDDGLDQIRALTVEDRIAFVKALAVMEHFAGGFGSVTALTRVLPLVPDPNKAVFDWILTNTRSYRYYAYGAESYAEFQSILAAKKRRREVNEALEAERAGEAKARRAAKASSNLFNAVRRRDMNAVQALLRQGADPHGYTPDGMSIVAYAKEINQIAIAETLQQAQSPQKIG